MLRKFKKGMKNSGGTGGHYVVTESKMDRKFPYQTKSWAKISKEEKEKLTPEEKNWIINRDMQLQTQNVD